MTVKQAATALNCSGATVYSLLNRGELPFVRVGRSKGYRIEMADIERCINERKDRREGPKTKVPRPKLKHIKI